jgi:hypothetical protein
MGALRADTEDKQKQRFYGQDKQARPTGAPVCPRAFRGDSTGPAMNTLLQKGALCLAALCLPLAALALLAPEGPVILTITGNIAVTNAPGAARFDLAMLKLFPQHAFTTLTPWGKQPIHFEGPLLRDVLALVKASGTSIRATALNDYQTSIPVADTQRFDVLLAHKMDGQAIPVKSKGPLFVIYPFGADETLRSPLFYERAAWQLKSLHLE